MLEAVPKASEDHRAKVTYASPDACEQKTGGALRSWRGSVLRLIRQDRCLRFGSCDFLAVILISEVAANFLILLGSGL